MTKDVPDLIHRVHRDRTTGKARIVEFYRWAIKEIVNGMAADPMAVDPALVGDPRTEGEPWLKSSLRP